MLVYNKFIDEGFDAEGRLNRFELKPGVDFNFGLTVLMYWVQKNPIRPL